MEKLFIVAGKCIEIHPPGYIRGDFDSLMRILVRSDHTGDIYELNREGTSDSIYTLTNKTGTGFTRDGVFALFRDRIFPAITGM